jgi:peptide/nickel transport system substrate-binding protein
MFFQRFSALICVLILFVFVCSKRFSLALPFFLLGAACLLSSGCSHNSPPADTITVAIDKGPDNLDPRIGTNSESERIDQLLFNSLVKRGPQLEILPDLASHWEIPDPITYRFHLRAGVRFHNGQALTSQDVRYTIESLLDGSITSSKASTYRVIASIKTPDDLTIVLHLKEPYASFLWNLTNGAIGIVPKGSTPDLYKSPVGTGPFRFVSHSQEEEVVIEANHEYFGQAPWLRRVRFKVIPDATTRALEMRKGSVDVAQNVLSPDFVEVLRKRPDLRLSVTPGTNYGYIGFNLTDPILKDRRVRRAIALAINREEIARYYWRDLVTLASGLLPPNHWAYEKAVATYGYDPAAATRLLDESGFRDPDGSGPKARFRLTFKTSTEESSRQVAAIIQQQLSQVGIAVDLRSNEFGTFYGDIVRGNFQMFTLRWVGGNNDPDLFERVFHSQQVPPKGWNRGRYNNGRIDELTELARKEPDQEKRRATYSEIQKILADDLPYVSLWYFKNVSLYRERVLNMALSPAGDYEFLNNIRLGELEVGKSE